MNSRSYVAVILRSIGRIAAITFVVFGTMLLFLQERMIYFPRSYSKAETELLERVATPLTFSTSQGRQRAYFIPAKQPTPRRLWAMFCGNGSVAADWVDVVSQGDPQDAFLLVDYPGYGASEGAASPTTIDESAEGAARLAQQLFPYDPPVPWGAVGQSLGCAAALQFAVKFHPDRVVLIAPFTTMSAMAKRQVGWPLSLLLKHRFDNQARLDELATHSPPPRVVIFHGSNDGLIPPSMGEQLARAHPEMVRFELVQDAGHNDVVARAQTRFLRAMTE